MLSKLKTLASFKKPDKGLIDLSQLSSNLCDGLFNVMEESFDQRANDSNNSKYTKSDVDKIIESYARKNMILAAATSMVPGPFGILGALPELLMNFKNQMDMMYDLGCANGKENFFNKDLLLDIPIAAFGGNTDLARLQNSNVDLINSPQDILQVKATELGKSVIERTLKKSIIQFIPIAGPIVMGTWAKLTTTKISNGAIQFLDDDKSYIEKMRPEEDSETQRLLQIEKIKGLANLIESNNDINENQIELIGTIIENSILTDSEKELYLEEAMKPGSQFKLNRKLLIDYEEEDDLVMELIVMAKRSGSIDELEKKYIYQVGAEMELDKGFIDGLF